MSSSYPSVHEFRKRHATPAEAEVRAYIQDLINRRMNLLPEGTARGPIVVQMQGDAEMFKDRSRDWELFCQFLREEMDELRRLGYKVVSQETRATLLWVVQIHWESQPITTNHVKGTKSV